MTRALDNGALVFAESLERTLFFDKTVVTWMLDDAGVILADCVVAEDTRALVIDEIIGTGLLESTLFGVYNDREDVEDVEVPFIIGI